SRVVEEDADENIASASSVETTGKCNVAQKFNLESFNPRTIALASVISTTDSVTDIFTTSIIDLFENVDGLKVMTRVRTSLAWWNKFLLCTRAAVAKTSRAADKKLRAQRARREVFTQPHVLNVVLLECDAERYKACLYIKVYAAKVWTRSPE
ncbi:hypothetical protein H0H93_006657, partial [Arthromyces matolae]